MTEAEWAAWRAKWGPRIQQAGELDDADPNSAVDYPEEVLLPEGPDEHTAVFIKKRRRERL